MRTATVVALVALSSAIGGNVYGDTYPNRPIRLVVPFAAGGTATINARVIGVQLERQMGQNIVIDNRPGANGIIGIQLVANATPDGYTMLYTTTSIAINESVYRKLPYDLFKDLEPVTIVALGKGYVLVANPSFAARSVKDLLSLAGKQKKVTFGSAGIGNSTHLVAEIFSDDARINMVHVPYKGVAPALNAVMGGEVNIMFIPPTIALPQIQAGRLRALGFTGKSRWSLLPNVPTVAEAGVPGFYNSSGFNAWFATGKTPKPILAKMQMEIRKALQVEKVNQVFVDGAYDAFANTPDEARQYLHEQVKAFGDIVRKLGIKPN